MKFQKKSFFQNSLATKSYLFVFSLNQSQSQGGVNTDMNLHQKVIKQTDLIELGQLT